MSILLFSFEASRVSNIRRKSLSPSVIVIGSGFAGLAAAYALKNASFKVPYFSLTFFFKRNRPTRYIQRACFG
jgi:NADPH-dependent 2,4-dienoyl-CoA reductase/sulfur reductase-like enzyme